MDPPPSAVLGFDPQTLDPPELITCSPGQREEEEEEDVTVFRPETCSTWCQVQAPDQQAPPSSSSPIKHPLTHYPPDSLCWPAPVMVKQDFLFLSLVLVLFLGSSQLLLGATPSPCGHKLHCTCCVTPDDADDVPQVCAVARRHAARRPRSRTVPTEREVE
ncbi:hypothetical protein F2P81_012504 [Scophthalmus maximus]|uniref:Uncharacterized protein n=1 Tax=Scophthalmus maximus TaxID=52904 RepID=A0A6A4SHW2_SCOMX|nr:hypothetical protein F2P81_012504 [Scophthalmus maximus]